MRICIFGAGAVGGHLAARLINASSGLVSVVARGAQLEAIRHHGVTLIANGERIWGQPLQVTDEPAELPPQDLVFVTLKAHSAPLAARAIGRLLAPRGVAIFVLNGIPWWWNYGLPRNAALPLLDPDGALWNHVGPQRVLGIVVNCPNEVDAPGVIIHNGHNRWVIGEPDNRPSERARAVVDLLTHSGLNAEVSPDLRRAIWQKLCTNVSNNPLAALTRLPSLSAAGLSDVGNKLIAETLEVAAQTGYDLRGSVNPQMSLQSGGPITKPSMLQDVEASRPMEVEAIMGQVQAFAREHKVDTPVLDIVLPLLRGLDASLRGET
jgi:2-dehydropantoate 2-reductase